MNKGLQIFLLGLVFLISGVAGFVIEELLFEKSVVVSEEPAPVAIQDTLSPVPVILAESIAAPQRNANGNFDFSVQAEVETSHQLKYALYKDEICTELVAENLSGVFSDVPPVSSKIYYIRVQNLTTGDCSDVVSIDGFTQLVMYQKITKAELEDLINVKKDYSMAPKDFKKRTSPSFQIIVNGANENERQVSDVADICMKTFNGVWSSVVVETVGYDRQNRLDKLTIRVNY